jgi:hypothetical protein
MNKILIIAGLAGTLALAVMGQQSVLPTYQTFTASGSTAAAVIIPQKPTSQPRVVSVVASSDSGTSTLNFYGGTTAFYVTIPQTNITPTAIYLNTTNGLGNNGGLLYVQGATSNVVVTISSYGLTNSVGTNGVGSSVTNSWGVVTATGGVGIPQLQNAEVELLSSSTVTLGLGVNSYRVYASDGIYVGNYGRAVYLTTTGGTNCALNAVTVHYDAASN